MKRSEQHPIRALFDGEYTPGVGYRPMTKEESAVWDEAQAILGEELVDKMLDAQSRSLVETQCDYFRAGFILGARLMLELQ